MFMFMCLLEQDGGTVSDKPIVMRAEYAHTSNLTLVDTPGAAPFRVVHS